MLVDIIDNTHIENQTITNIADINSVAMEEKQQETFDSREVDVEVETHDNCNGIFRVVVANTKDGWAYSLSSSLTK